MPACAWRLRGSSRQPKLTKIRPMRGQHQADRGEVEHLEGLAEVSWRTWLTMMLVEVPTRVTSPPSSDMNDIGISSAEREVLVVRVSADRHRHQDGQGPDILGEH